MHDWAADKTEKEKFDATVQKTTIVAMQEKTTGEPI
jgi:hypothetical protein